MVKITNKDKQAENNIENINYRIDDDKHLGYDDFVYYNEDIEESILSNYLNYFFIFIIKYLI